MFGLNHFQDRAYDFEKVFDNKLTRDAKELVVY